MEIRKTAINTQMIIAIGLVIIGVMLRLVPHIPNFAPVGAIALFGGALLNWRLALWLPLGVMMLSDMVLGGYPGIEFTWAGFLLVVLWGMMFRRRRFLSRVTIGAIGSSGIFFVVSNFGVWVASGMYAHTASGLAECYVLALPFYTATLLADMTYAAVFFGVYEAVRRVAVNYLPHRTNIDTMQ